MLLKKSLSIKTNEILFLKTIVNSKHFQFNLLLWRRIKEEVKKTNCIDFTIPFKSTKAIFCLCAFLFLQNDSVAQSEDHSDKFLLIELAKKYWTDSLKFSLPENFYTNTSNVDTSMLYYVYSSRKDSILPPEKFGDFKYCDNSNEALKIDSLQKTSGFDSFIYKTAGNANFRINETLLTYDDESMIFILFHEATHYIIKENYPQLPYNFNEALCDHNANCLTLNFFRSYPELNYEAAVYQKNRIELIYNSINENYISFITEGKFSKSTLFLLSELINSTKTNNMFLLDRYRYPLNNAYFLRNNYYSNNYFFLNIYFENRSTFQIHQNLEKLLTAPEIARLQNVSNIIYKKRQ